jgi:hypothetical protein
MTALIFTSDNQALILPKLGMKRTNRTDRATAFDRPSMLQSFARDPPTADYSDLLITISRGI